MVHISGQEQFELPAETVWKSLVDPRFLCQCFPDVDRIVNADDRSATLIVRPGFSFVRGTLEISFEFVDLKPASHGQVTIQLKGIGSSAKLESAFDVTSSDSGSAVEWTADVRELGGLLKAVSHGLMQGAAQKVAADTWSNIRTRLAAGNTV
jgi:carbon monoxide dehydrogenase subunit G